MPTCLSRVSFGSFLVYSPHGVSEISKQSRTITYNIKSDRAGAIERVVARLGQEMVGPSEGRPLRAIELECPALLTQEITSSRRERENVISIIEQTGSSSIPHTLPAVPKINSSRKGPPPVCDTSRDVLPHA